MRQALFVLSLALVLGVTVGNVVEVVELDIYSSLAPCAKYAVSYHIQKQTYSKCPDDATALQECICTKNNNFASISSEVSSSIVYSCGSTATEDQASASTVLSAYCNQESLPTFPTPTVEVNAYITEVAEVAALAPCAQNALGYAVGSLTYTHCPSDAPALASCACSKFGMSSLAAKGISSSAKYSCSSHTADVSSALAFFDAFCAMGEGISEFPRPTNPPGDMTYYITDLPAYTSLANCAASAISYAVQWQTEDLCPEGPQALASCACLKDGMTKEILSSISSNVRYSCDSTATDDISSAVSVYNYYCSAAQSLVVAEGVTASVEQPTIGGPPVSGSRSGSGAQATGTGASGGSNGSKLGDDETSSGPSTGVIVGAIVGVIVLLGLIGLAVFFVMRHARKKKGEQLPDNVPMAASPGNADYYGNGKQELPADSIATGAIPPPSPAPSTLKPGTLPPRSETVSPVSAHGGTFSPPTYHAELSGQAPPVPPLPHSAELPVKASPYPPMPQGAELQGHAPAYSPPANTAELYGQGATYQHPPRPELQGQGAMYPPQHRPELQGNGAMYPPPTRPELQGQGAPYPGPFRQELAGQYNYLPPPQQPPQAYGGYNTHPPVSPAGTYVQNSPSPHTPGMGWQSGPVPMVHEMDGGYAQSPPGQAR